MNIVRPCVAVAGTLFLSAAAHATVIDFNYLHNTQQTVGIDGSIATPQGYTFANDAGGYYTFEVFGTAFPIASWNVDPSGAAIWVENPFSNTTLTQTAGGVFNLSALDIADGTNGGWTATPQGTLAQPFVRFTFNYATGGSFSESFGLDNLPGTQTLNFGSAGVGVTSVTYATIDNGADGYIQFDNVVVTTAAVPEPAGLATILAGVATLGAVFRRRKQIGRQT